MRSSIVSCERSRGDWPAIGIEREWLFNIVELLLGCGGRLAVVTGSRSHPKFVAAGIAGLNVD